MSFFEKYLMQLALTDKVYSLSVLDNSEQHFLTVSDKKFKIAEVIKESIEIKISVSFIDMLNEDDNFNFPTEKITTDSENAYSRIVEHLKKCLTELKIDFKEELFDFAETKSKTTFKYEISKNEFLFVKAKIDEEIIY